MNLFKIMNTIKNEFLAHFVQFRADEHTCPSDAYLHYQQARCYEFQAKLQASSSPNPTAITQNFHERNAIWCFLHSASEGYSSAQFKLGQCYLNGQLGLNSNPQKAQLWFGLAANQGHAEAQLELEKMPLST